MAGDAGLVDLEDEGVAVAVEEHVDERLGLARRLALPPQGRARARVVYGAAGEEGLGDGGGGHVGEH